jgi:hypothetical protein
MAVARTSLKSPLEVLPEPGARPALMRRSTPARVPSVVTGR